MTALGENVWGKSSVRLSKVLPDGFLEVSVQVLLTGEVEGAYLRADNAAVLPTDTMRNTVYVLAQDHLTHDLEAFAGRVADHFVARDGVHTAAVTVQGRPWQKVMSTGYLGGSSERRIARVEAAAGHQAVWGGIEGLAVLKTTGSAFTGFPRDAYTTLPEREDRILATTISGEWSYDPVPGETTAIWERIRGVLTERFCDDWSASVQHQGWQMAEAILAAVPEVARVGLSMPNQHHLDFDFAKLGVEDRRVVFQPVSEPYGDIRFTATR